MKIKLINPEQNPPPVEIISTSIVEIAAAIRKMRSTRLSDDAIITLVHRSCSGTVSRSDIEKVIQALEDLEKDWLKKTK